MQMSPSWRYSGGVGCRQYRHQRNARRRAVHAASMAARTSTAIGDVGRVRKAIFPAAFGTADQHVGGVVWQAEHDLHWVARHVPVGAVVVGDIHALPVAACEVPELIQRNT